MAGNRERRGPRIGILLVGLAREMGVRAHTNDGGTTYIPIRYGGG